MTDANAVLEMLKAEGYRMTPQRRAIVAEIMSVTGHISPQAVVEVVQKKVPGVNASTVYRTLELLENLGVLRHAHLEGGAEYHLADEHDHVHLICARCKRADSLTIEEVEPLRRLVQKHNGFHPDFTHFAISGLCAECQKLS